MNILLVYPQYPTTFWSFKYALKFIAKKASLPPLGLLTVSAILPAGWNRRLVDLNIKKLSADDLGWADYVLVSAMSIQKESVDAVINRCKALGKKVIAGGPLFTAHPEDYGHVDHLVLNEAEITLPLVLADLATGTARHIYTSPDWAELATTPV
ncbi:MAG TPA: cobalamin-dependent protein, partial [Nitrospirota bacterium]